MKSIDQSELLKGAAARAAINPVFLGYVLTKFAEQEGISENQLADRLVMHPSFLPRLFLCKRPDPRGPDFAEKISAISDYCLAATDALAVIVRQVEAVESLSVVTSEQMLAAARDRDDREKPPPPEVTSDKNTGGDE